MWKMLMVLGPVTLVAITVGILLVAGDDPSSNHPGETQKHLLADLKSNSHQTEESVDQVRQELDQLKHRLHRVVSVQSDVADRVARLSEQRQENAPASKQRVGIAGESSQQENDEYLEQEETMAQVVLLEQAFESGAIDPDWSYQAEKSLKTVLHQDELANANLVGTSCRSTFCRVELSFENQQMRNDAMQSFPNLLPWAGEGFFHATNGEDPNVVFYVAREGHALPRVQQ